MLHHLFALAIGHGQVSGGLRSQEAAGGCSPDQESVAAYPAHCCEGVVYIYLGAKGNQLFLEQASRHEVERIVEGFVQDEAVSVIRKHTLQCGVTSARIRCAIPSIADIPPNEKP